MPGPIQCNAPPPPNRTGLPDGLKAGVEALSGLSMDDVRVHRNSSRPARLQAHAFAQGTDTHLAPGQERHLPHEAWHVVQQKQGRVRATAQLEAQADRMGALSLGAGASLGRTASARSSGPASGPPVAQCYGAIRFANLGDDDKYKTKARDIIEALQNTAGIGSFLARKNTLITLAADPQLATVKIVDDQVQITLSPWFFEQESRGRILGMLAHEFGVHPLAREKMTGLELNREQTDIHADTAFATGIPGHAITPGAAGQTDHVFAAIAGQPRFVIYRRTVHQMATAMVQQSREDGSTVKKAHVTDAIMTYLSDIAMILATNDHRGQIVAQPQRTADAFNLERTRWINSLTRGGDDDELIRLTPGVKTKSNVLNEVRGIAGSFMLSMFTKSTSATKTHQAATGPGAVAPVTSIQAEVLKDYGLALAAAPAGPSLFDALDVIHNPDHARTAALVKLGGVGIHDRAYAVANRVVGEIRGGAFDGEVSSESLDIAAQGVDRTIRVIHPGGKINITDNHGAKVTVLLVPKPAPHYRAAE